MPETFPTWDDQSQSLVQTEYFTLAEVAEMLHVSAPTARKIITEDNWPHLKVLHRIYLTAEDISHGLESMRSSGIPEGGTDTRLGIPILSDPFLTDPADDRGGVQ